MMSSDPYRWMRSGEPVRLVEPESEISIMSPELGFIDTFLDGSVLAHGVYSGMGMYPYECVLNQPPFTVEEMAIIDRAKSDKTRHQK